LQHLGHVSDLLMPGEDVLQLIRAICDVDEKLGRHTGGRVDRAYADRGSTSRADRRISDAHRQTDRSI
jgi:hypothetical protein